MSFYSPVGMLIKNLADEQPYKIKFECVIPMHLTLDYIFGQMNDYN